MKSLKKLTAFVLSAALLAGLTGCSDNAGSANANNNNQNSPAATSGAETENAPVSLTFLNWDKFQTPGMEAMAAAYTEKNPNVTIQVQTTSWDEYWTKLEASATGSSMPDIFWMHTNELLKYTTAGILADVTNLYDDISPTYYTDHFSAVSIGNTLGTDGKMYGVPKDKDTVGLVYNKEMFDAAGVAYPDENWTWDNLVDASRKIHTDTGKFGYMAYFDEQLGYWNFVYQAGGYILDENNNPGFTQPGTKKAMEFYVGLQSEDFCPDQNYFAETDPATAFFSELGAMYLEGNWNLRSKLDDFPNMVGKWDVAVLPKCPDPVSGDGRATISNGLCYATAANGKNKETALDFIQFLGTEEAMIIQGQYGSAIPAYIGTESHYTEGFKTYDYEIAIGSFFDMFDYGVQYINSLARPEWRARVLDELLKVYRGQVDLDTALQNSDQYVIDANQKVSAS